MYNRFLVRIKPQFYFEMNGMNFFIKRNLFWDKWTIYKQRSGKLVPFMWRLGEPYIDGVFFFCEQQREDFFKDEE